MNRGLRAFAVIGALLVAVPLPAQTLRETFESLYVFGECGEPVCLDVAASVHGRHFSVLAEEAGTDMIGFVLQSIGSSLSNIPIPSANSGEIFFFEDGELVSTPTSAGPAFIERSQTLGRENLLVGFNLGRSSMSNIRGQSLEDLTLTFTHEDVGTAGLGEPDFENDVIEVVSDIDLAFTFASVFLTYGVTNTIDIGLAVPIVSASLSGTSSARIRPFEGTASPHGFNEDGEVGLTATSSADATSTGVGDIALRAKANLSQSDAWGLAALGEIRLPTGDEDNFQGTGETTARILGIVSGRSGTFSPHANAGFTLRTGEANASSLSVRAGLDALLSESVTGSIEVLGDFLVQDVSNDEAVTREVAYQFPVERVVSVSEIPDRRDHVLDFVGAVKVQPAAGFRVVGSMLVPLMEGGVRPNFQWAIGVERIF